MNPNTKGASIMERPLIVIKLGGSAITDKTRIYTPRVHEITRAAKQVAAVSKRFSLILIHGAGSYGHIPVRKFGLAHGFKDSKQLKGLTATKSRLLEWEMIFDRILLKHQVPLVPFVASSLILARDGRIFSAELEPLKHWLRLGCVPSVGGDIIPDLETGFSILSGDQLASYLAVKLEAKKLIFATDVDGIFDSDPKLNPKAALITNLTPSSASRLASKAVGKTAPDVTGGMGGKMKEAAVAASAGIAVYLVNLTKDERLQRAAFGQRVLCSSILPA